MTPQPPRSGKGRKPKVVTLQQVADRLGFSVATVSRVLNVDPTLTVTDETRRAVIETAEAMDYAPPRLRRKGKTSATGKITLLHHLRQEQELVDPFYVALRLGIEKRCAERHREFVNVYHNGTRPDEALLAEADGIIVVGPHSFDEVHWLRSHSKHLVFAAHEPAGDEIDSVTYDLRVATKKILDGLSDVGYRRIAMAGWYESRIVGLGDKVPETRPVAYTEWMQKRGSFDPDLLRYGSSVWDGGMNTAEAGFDIMHEFLALPNRPDAVVFCNDTMAVGAYRAMRDAGLSIPEDIAIAGFNDISASRFMNPPLTTVRLPAEEIGETAVDLLIERFGGRDIAKRVRLECRMVWRDSTRQP